MKQELSRAESKASPPVPAVRSRVSRAKDSPDAKCSVNGISSPESKKRAKAAPLEAANAPGARRPILLNKLRPAAVDDGKAPKERVHEDPKAVCLPKSRAVEQYARLQRRTDAGARKPEKETSYAKAKELQSRVDESDKVVAELRNEVLSLKGQLQKLGSRNVELELQNRKLAGDLSAAEAKIRALEGRHQVASAEHQVQRSANGDVQKVASTDVRIIAEEVQDGDMSPMIHSSSFKPNAKPLEVQSQVRNTSLPLATGNAIVKPPPSPPPPPPPPPASRHVGGANVVSKAYPLVELYRSLTRRDGKKDAMGNGLGAPNNNRHNSIVGELQNRSTHLLAIKADVESKGDLVKHLIEKVYSASCADMEDVLTFVDYLDGELSKLVDETAVLKHFSWPEKKVDAMREASFEYRNIKMLEAEVYGYGYDASMPCEVTLRKITHLFDKLERSTQRLIKLRNPAMALYKECKLPTDWMLDSGIVSKMKMASVKLAKLYIKRVSMELESARCCERESAQEALLLQGVRLAYRAHQFAGGLDSETMLAVEELKRRVQSHTGEPKN